MRDFKLASSKLGDTPDMTVIGFVQDEFSGVRMIPSSTAK